MAAAKTLPEPDRTVQRLIGRGKAKLDDSRRKLDELEGKPRAKQPSVEDITEDITEEISAVIREELGKRKSDAPALSAQAFGVHLSARGRVVWLVAVLLALLAGGVLLGRITAPRHERAPDASQHK